jgi:hypothetical protein
MVFKTIINKRGLQKKFSGYKILRALLAKRLENHHQPAVFLYQGGRHRFSLVHLNTGVGLNIKLDSFASSSQIQGYP